MLRADGHRTAVTDDRWAKPGRLRFVGHTKRQGLVVVLLAAMLASALLVGPAPSAHAARGLTTGLIDDNLFTSSSRDLWLDRAEGARTGLIRVNVPWREVVASSPPQNPTNPGDPAYAAMSNVDATVAAAGARGFDVLLTVSSAPDWAEGPNEPAGATPGTWKPDARAFGQFGQMLATRYSGSYNGLPQVRYFEAWNEPNLSNYLSPQWAGTQLYSPVHYREMLNNFYFGVKSVQPGAKVLGGATAPFGDDYGQPFIPGKERMRPMVFLRRMFCLRDNLKPYSCPTKPHLDILSHHPVNIVKAPARPAANPDDVVVADFHKLGKALRAAEAGGKVVPGGFHPLWASEIWWYTNPPNPIGVPLQKEARWLEQGLYLLWKQGAQTVINYQIRDHPPDPNLEPRQQVTTGIFFQDGTKKPAYTAWRFPFVTHRTSTTNVGVWGKSPVAGLVRIQQRRQGQWQRVGTVTAHRNEVFTSSIVQRGHAYLRAKVGLNTSLSWYQN
jgi:hypothetical protein